MIGQMRTIRRELPAERTVEARDVGELEGATGHPATVAIGRLAQRAGTRAEEEAQYGLGFLEAEIPHAARIESAAARREPLTATAPASTQARAFERLLDEVEARLDAESPLREPKKGELRDLVDVLEGRRRT